MTRPFPSAATLSPGCPSGTLGELEKFRCPGLPPRDSDLIGLGKSLEPREAAKTLRSPSCAVKARTTQSPARAGGDTVTTSASRCQGSSQP